MAKKEKKTVNKKEKNSKDKTSFFKGFKAELKKVNWPTLKQLFNNTSAVIAIVLILAVIVFVLDFVFESANKYGLDKIKEAVISSTQENTKSDEEGNANEGTQEDNQATQTDNTAETTNQAQPVE